MPRRRHACFVVDEHVPAALQLVHAVDARLELHAGDIELAFFLERLDLERRPTPLDLQPLASEPRETLALELGVTALQAHLTHRDLRRLANDGREVLLQVRVRAYACPDLAHQRMQELAAIARIESRRGLLHLIGTEAPAGKGAERARRLVGEHPRAAALHARLDTRRSPVLEAFELARSKEEIAVARIVRQLERRFSDARDQRARREIAILVLGGMREHHFGGRMPPFVGGAPIERSRAFRARLRDAGPLLQGDRDEWIWPRIPRPGFVRQAAHPQAIEALLLRLDDA